MKIAICISGQPRTATDIVENHKSTILNDSRLDVDTFMHLWWSDNHRGKVMRCHASERYPDEDMSKNMIEAYHPIKYLIEDYKNFDQDFCIAHNYETWGKDLPQKFYDIFTPLVIYTFLSQSFSVMQSTKLCYELGGYDISIRLRSDVFFVKDIVKILKCISPNDNEIYFQSSMNGGHIYSGEHPNNPCDWFFCGTPKAVSHFSETWHTTISTIFKNGLLHNSQTIPAVAKKANLEIKLVDFGAHVYRQLNRDLSTPNGDPYFIPYQKYLDDFDSTSFSIIGKIHDWPHYVKHVKFRRI